jgi:hypothetical protein
MNGLSNMEPPTKPALLDLEMSVHILREFILAHVDLLSFPGRHNRT